MRALIYARVSSDPKNKGRSVDEQVDECQAWADREGWDVVDIIRDTNRSASRHARRQREGWAEVGRLVEAGAVDVLVTWEASRAQRDLGAYVELRQLCVDHGVRWAYSGSVYDLNDRTDRQRSAFDAVMAEDESERTRERVLRAMRANATKGRPHGRLVFGYRRVYDEHTGDLIRQEPDPERAPLVREAARRFLAGESTRSIANDWNARGIPTPHPSGTRWDLSQVKRVITNPAMAGRRVHRGEVVGAGDWTAILDDDTFDAVAVRFADPSRTTTRRSPTVRLLTGVARCGVCGGPMVYAKQGGFVDRKTGRKRTLRYTYTCKNNHCTARDLDALEQYVSAVVVERLRRPDARDAIAGAKPDEHTAEALSEAAEVRRQLDDAIIEFTAGRLTAATLGRIESELLPRITDAERRGRVAGLPTVAADVALDDDPAAAWAALETEQKREVLRALMVVIVDPVKVRGRKGFDPSAVRIEWKR
jgi:site-specific DNA recombinase